MIAISALLLPGLVFAAPVAGACGLCERGVPCPDMTPRVSETTADSCCGDMAVDRHESQTPSSFSSPTCDCGRTAPAAIASTAIPTIDDEVAVASGIVGVAENSASGEIARRNERPPAPPPTRPIFLVDCAFLT